MSSPAICHISISSRISHSLLPPSSLSLFYFSSSSFFLSSSSSFFFFSYSHVLLLFTHLPLQPSFSFLNFSLYSPVSLHLSISLTPSHPQPTTPLTSGIFISGSGRSLIVFALASSLTVTTRALARNSRDSSFGGSPGVSGGEWSGGGGIGEGRWGR
jgi:hypothetical protein